MMAVPSSGSNDDALMHVSADSEELFGELGDAPASNSEDESYDEQEYKGGAGAKYASGSGDERKFDEADFEEESKYDDRRSEAKGSGDDEGIGEAMAAIEVPPLQQPQPQPESGER